VSAAEAGASVASGEAYLDLHHLNRGVLTAKGHAPIHNVLPKQAVSEQLWLQIMKHAR